ncbi:MAG: hypothetical protein MZW92_48175 [Comamonadaceae bacterium]|nr:hypothetical protein [Comamonadaceae bacterium]
MVTRHLSPEMQAEGRFEITFWRSLFAALTRRRLPAARAARGLRPVVARRAGPGCSPARCGR